MIFGENEGWKPLAGAASLILVPLYTFFVLGDMRFKKLCGVKWRVDFSKANWVSTIGGFINGETVDNYTKYSFVFNASISSCLVLKSLKWHSRLKKTIALWSRGFLQRSYSTLQSLKIETFLNAKNVNYDQIAIDFIYGLASSETRIKMKQNQVEERLTIPNLVFHIHYQHMLALGCQS